MGTHDVIAVGHLLDPRGAFVPVADVVGTIDPVALAEACRANLKLQKHLLPKAEPTL